MKTRVISAIFILAVFIPFMILGGTPFASFMLVLGLLGLWELLKLKRGEKELPFIIEVLAYLMVSFLILSNYDSKDLSFVMDYRVLSFLVFAFIMPIVIVDEDKKYNLSDAFFMIGSILFIGLSFNLMILVRNYSLMALVYFFVITVITDTFAFITGSLVGRHKLAEKISPKKTVEGLVGGTIMGTFVAMVFYLTVVNPAIDFFALLIITLTLSLIGQLGDLVFSAIKRHYKVKDYSNLIPGHGGILDRFDSIIFVILAAILFISVL